MNLSPGPTFCRGEEDPCQLHPAALAAGQGSQLLGQNTFGQAKTRADAAGLAFRGITTEGGEPLLQLAVAAHSTVAGRIIGDLGHQGLLLLQVGKQRVQASCGQHPITGQHF